MDQNANFRAFLKGKEVPPYRTGNVYNKYDGKKIDLLEMQFLEIKSRKDCEELIKFLEVHKFCFDNPSTPIE